MLRHSASSRGYLNGFSRISRAHANLHVKRSRSRRGHSDRQYLCDGNELAEDPAAVDKDAGATLSALRWHSDRQWLLLLAADEALEGGECTERKKW